MNPRVPKDLETTVLKCLRKDSGDRYGTAEALGQDLWRFVRGDAIEARPPTRVDRVASWLSRTRFRIAVGLGVLLILGLGSNLVLDVWSRRQRANSATYERLVTDGLDSLDVGALSPSGELDEGDRIAFGLTYEGEMPEGVLLHAVEVLEEAAGLIPERPEAWTHLSRALRALGDERHASRALDRALKNDPRFLPARLLEAYFEQPSRVWSRFEFKEARDEPCEELWLQAAQAATRRDWDSAYRLYSELLGCSWEDRPFAGFRRELQLRLGRIAFKRQKTQRAIRHFAAVYEESGRAADPTLLLAAAYYHADFVAAAADVLTEGVERHAASEFATRVAALHQHYGRIDEARKVVETIPEEAERSAALVSILHAEGRHEEALRSGERALQLGFDEPGLYAKMARILFHEVGQTQEARNLLESALRKFPYDPEVAAAYAGVLYYLCQYEDLVQFCGGRPEQTRVLNSLGWAHLRLGNIPEAIEAFDRFVTVFPRGSRAQLGLSNAWMYAGDFEKAVARAVRHVALAPEGFFGLQLRYLYLPEHRQHFDPHWDDLRGICENAVRRGVARARYLGFGALACVRGSTPDLDQGLRWAEEAVELGGELLAESLGCLGEVRFARGETDRAIRALERATTLNGCWLESVENLRRYRAYYAPRLASCASVDDYVRGGIDSGQDPPFPDRTELRKYLEAVTAEAAGDRRGALQILQELKGSTLAEEEVFVRRLAGGLHRAGRSSEALELLEGFATRAPRDAPGPWSEWMKIASSDAALSIAGLIDRLMGIAESADEHGPAVDDVLWVLNSLQEQRSLRINCGGPDHMDSTGVFWGRDRFFVRGRPYGLPRPQIDPSQDPELFYDHRRFRPGESPSPGYRIPLPSDHYLVVVRFCETSPFVLKSGFDVTVEGSLRGSVEPQLGELVEVRWEGFVGDGALDISLTLRGYSAFVNSIEITSRIR